MIDNEIRFIWNIDDKLLNKFIKTKNDLGYFSDNFANNCLTLMCRPRDKDMVKLKVRLLRMPYGIENYNVSVRMTAYCDNYKIIHEIDDVLLNLSCIVRDMEMRYVTMFPSKDLELLTVLSFVVDINISAINKQ